MISTKWHFYYYCQKIKLIEKMACIITLNDLINFVRILTKILTEKKIWWGQNNIFCGGYTLDPVKQEELKKKSRTNHWIKFYSTKFLTAVKRNLFFPLFLVTVKKPLLRKANKLKRLHWAEQYMNWILEDWKIYWQI